ncbi:MAG: hypothetical protein ACI4PR_03375 [Acutalibacteraceae bacterium]
MNESTDSEETKNSHGISKGEIEFGLKIIESMPKSDSLHCRKQQKIALKRATFLK